MNVYRLSKGQEHRNTDQYRSRVEAINWETRLTSD